MVKNEFIIPSFISNINIFSDSEKILIYASRGDALAVSDILGRCSSLNLELSDHRGYTALHFACVNGYDDIIDLLVDRKEVNLNQLDKMARPPIQLAWIHKRFNASKKLMEAVLKKHKSYLGKAQRDRFIDIIFSNQNDILGQVQDISKIFEIEIEDLERINRESNIFASFYL